MSCPLSPIPSLVGDLLLTRAARLFLTFDKTSATVFHPNSYLILKGWRNLDGPRLWQFPLTVSPPPAALLPPLVAVSVVPASAMLAVQPLPSQGIHATNATGDDIPTVFLYGVARPSHGNISPGIQHCLRPTKP
jgi:hypothetical protein